MEPTLKSKRLHIGGATLIIVGVLAVLYFLGGVLLVFGLSVVIAYVLLPIAKLIERAMPWRRNHPSLARGIAVGLIFLVGVGAIIGLAFAVIPPTIDQGRQFIEDFPSFLNSARLTLERWVDRYADIVPADVRVAIEEALAGAGDIVGQATWNVAKQTLGVIAGSFTFVLALATAPILVFYLMKDSAPVRESLHKPFPSVVHPYLVEVLTIADRTLGGYIRGQLLLGAVVGTIVAVGLLLLDVPFAFLLGIVAGITELVPIIGPWVGGAVGVLVTLATEPDKVLWVILLYLIVQLLENTLLVPRIQAGSLNLHPVAIILVITIGSQYFGLWGVILGPPVVALAKETAVYLVREWNAEPVAEVRWDETETPVADESAPEEEELAV